MNLVKFRLKDSLTSSRVPYGILWKDHVGFHGKAYSTPNFLSNMVRTNFHFEIKYKNQLEIPAKVYLCESILCVNIPRI